ncbi:glycoside hydrolase family 127 protein [Frateuria aurantia]
MKPSDRRRFLAGSATAVSAVLAGSSRLRADTPPPDVPAQLTPGLAALRLGPREQVRDSLQGFALDQVSLLPGPFADAADINIAYLHRLPVDRLAHNFLHQAGLPSSAAPLGGWESPECELRGHFCGGHYLSAAALAWAAHGDTTLKQRADELVGILARCQRSDGYLSAFPDSFFDRLSHGQKVWAPFYTIHKILAGHLDMYMHAGNRQALRTAIGIGDWTVHWLNGYSDTQMAAMQKTEYGGMNDALYELYAITGNGRYLDAAHRFDQASLFDPLAAHRDELQGLHSNTQLPKIIGAARRYELTGEQRYRRIAEFAWETISGTRCYANGGSSNDEFWNTGPDDLHGQLGIAAAECCVAYNLLKLTRHVYGWTGDPRAFDYYERNLYNARLGTQDPAGLKLYYYPLAPGSYKYFNSALHSFWCCTGTGAEDFARFNDNIYFHAPGELFVNLYVASQLDWHQQGLRLRQNTRFPEQDSSELSLHLAAPVQLRIHLRIPAWVAATPRLWINDELQDISASPGSYLSIERRWHDQDRLRLELPMQLHTLALPGDDQQFALMYGPLVLAAELPGAPVTAAMQHCDYWADPKPAIQLQPAPMPRPAAGKTATLAWIQSHAGQPLQFTADTTQGPVSVRPLNQMQAQRYALYWRQPES